MVGKPKGDRAMTIAERVAAHRARRRTLSLVNPEHLPSAKTVKAAADRAASVAPKKECKPKREHPELGSLAPDYSGRRVAPVGSLLKKK